MSVAKRDTGIELPPVEELIFQRGEMLLLDRVLERGAEHVVVTAKRLAREHPLLDPVHGMPIWVGIELMAQTVAVFSGLDHRQRGLPPRIGLLLGTRSFDAHIPFVAHGTGLVIRAELLWRDTGGLGVFACELRDDRQQLLASAQVKGYVPEDIRAHLGDIFDG